MNLQFEQQATRDQEPLSIEPYDRWLMHDGRVGSLFYRLGTQYLVRFPDLADFTIDLGERRVSCAPAPGMPDEAIADMYFNQIIPLVMGSDGDLILHASAVAAGGAAVAFLGSTGRGKSTLAAAFARAGHPFLTDDGLILSAAGDGYVVHPRRPILRLRQDSEAAILRLPDVGPTEIDQLKSRVAARPEIPFHDELVPLAAIYLLTEPRPRDDVAIAPLTPAVALCELIGHSFILDVEDRARVRAHFHRLAELAGRQRCYTLDFPRRYDALPGVIDAIIAHTAGTAQDSAVSAMPL